MTGRTRAVILACLRQHPGSAPREIAEGAGLGREVAKTAPHSSIAITSRYLHGLPNAGDKAQAALDRAFGRAS